MIRRYLFAYIWVLPLLLGACATPAPSTVPTTAATTASVPTPAADMPGATMPAETSAMPTEAVEATTMIQTTSTITIQDPFVRPSVDLPTNTAGQGGGGGGGGGTPLFGEGTSLIFMILINQSSTDDVLTSVTTDVANTVEFFFTEPVRQISLVEQIAIPGSGAVVVGEGQGYHIVLTDLTRELRVDDTVTFTLTFQNAGDVTVTAPVRLPREIVQP